MTTHCALCGGGTVTPDGHCWDCGQPQPAFRSHLEITTGGGAGVSDRGLRRGVNADAMALAGDGAWTIGVVCDGVSMSPRSERAARIAADTGAATLAARLRAGALPETALADAATRAGRAVAALAESADAAPACTYVAGVVGQGGIWACWIGDSRAYWLPDEGAGMALTEDDTGAHEALSAWLGADAGDPDPRIRSYRPPGPGRTVKDRSRTAVTPPYRLVSSRTSIMPSTLEEGPSADDRPEAEPRGPGSPPEVGPVPLRAAASGRRSCSRP